MTVYSITPLMAHYFTCTGRPPPALNGSERKVRRSSVGASKFLQVKCSLADFSKRKTRFSACWFVMNKNWFRTEGAMQISENKRKTQKIPIYFNKRIPPIKCMQIKVRGRLPVPLFRGNGHLRRHSHSGHISPRRICELFLKSRIRYVHLIKSCSLSRPRKEIYYAPLYN